MSKVQRLSLYGSRLDNNIFSKCETSILMDDDIVLNVTREFPGFKSMTEKNFKSFSGIDDMTINTATVNHGFNNNEYKVNAK